MNSQELQIHLQNKGECFDGMRAYHNSELSHKKDCIEVFKTSMTVVVLVFGGLAGAAITGKVPDILVYIATSLILVSVVVLVGIVLYSTNRKIEEDSARYKLYSEEYKLERRFLGLERDLSSVGYESAWIARKPTGAPYTKKILRASAALVVSSGVVGGLFATGLAYTMGPSAPEQSLGELLRSDRGIIDSACESLEEARRAGSRSNPPSAISKLPKE